MDSLLFLFGFRGFHFIRAKNYLLHTKKFNSDIISSFLNSLPWINAVGVRRILAIVFFYILFKIILSNLTHL